MLLIADAGHFGAGVFHPFLLFADLFVHGGDGAVEDFLFFLDSPVLINIDDSVRDIGGELRIGIENADLKKVGISNLINVEFIAQHLVGGFARRPAPFASPLILQLQLLDNGIKNAGALNDLVDRRRKLRIVDCLVGIALTEDARIFCGRSDLNENG